MEIKAKIIAGKLDKNRYAFAIPDGDKLKWVSAFLTDGKYLNEEFNESLRSIKKDDWVKMEVEENKGFLNIKKIEKIEPLEEKEIKPIVDIDRQSLIVAQSSLKEAVNTVGLMERLQMTNTEIVDEILRIWQIWYDEVWKKIKK